MAEVRWTEAQEKAVRAVGRDVRVSASAGTGKTAVLAQRCLERLCDVQRPTDVDRLLLLTYTDAAAEEMRDRIARTLRKAYSARPSSALRRQMLLLDAASISTFHAFCKRILSEHFYLLNLAPDFGIVDPDQQTLLQTEALAQTLEEAWGEPTLAEGLRVLLSGRTLYGTKGFVEEIFALADFLESIPDPQQFLERIEGFCTGHHSAADALRREQLRIIERRLGHARQKVEMVRRLQDAFGASNWLTGHLAGYHSVLDSLEAAVRQGDCAKLWELLAGLSIPSAPRRPKEMSEEIADHIKAPLKDVRDDLKEMMNLAAVHPVYASLEGDSVRLQMRTILMLLKGYVQHYTQAKEQIAALDFSDLEHKTVRLLEAHPAVADKLRRRFDFIFVDEFQDINAVQKRILDSIRRPDNVFVVGDVKQSIYAFRRSRPELFLEALQEAREDPTEPLVPQRIDLGDNFRSRPEILAFANAVFGRIMTKETASMDYDKRAALVCGRDDVKPEEISMPVEVVVLDEEGRDSDEEDFEGEENGAEESSESVLPEAENLSAEQRQAMWIARRIRQIVGADSGKPEFQIFDKELGFRRDVQYRDIVILMRSPAKRAQTYTEILRLAGIPLHSQTSEGYFETTEIADMLALLKVLDNPIRDIELAAVLRSALFNFTDSELARIRLSAGKAVTFYECVQKTAEAAGPLAQKARRALEQLSDWRRRIRIGSLSDVLGSILDQTGYLAFVSALPNGRQRRANLLKLHQRAVQFEHFSTGPQSVSLARFVEFLEDIRREKQDWAPAQPDSAAENAVRLLSVHKSKGLEFPVVFLAELNAGWNPRDLNRTCLADEDALGIQAVCPERNIQFPTLAWQVLYERKRKTMFEEEMRILYVALTRAREKLILTASRRRSACEKIVQECALLGDKGIPDGRLLEVSCPMDWILFGLGRQPPMKEVFLNESPAVPTFFTVQCVERDGLEACSREIEAACRRKLAASVPTLTEAERKQHQPVIEECRRILEWKYPFSSAVGLVAKLSVSGALEMMDEFAPAVGADSFGSVPKAVLEKAGKKSTLSSAQIGSAAHLLLARLDLHSKPDRQQVANTIEALVTEGLINSQTAAALEPEWILGFFDSELGQLALKYPDRVHREWAFTISVSAREARIAPTDEKIIVQGIVDLLLDSPDGLILADFKTDRVSEGQWPQRVERYRPQLRLYALAVEKVLGRVPSRAYLYFLAHSKSVPIVLSS
ncbi:MAG TPA: helicase-exonuclease AddAB subunit AddA [Anaerohalosphaeraceae bacterium]|nr:helicase-exonuclease AddAB subunit AddA [Anaerohalosphaeraceae bacterium]HOL88799.1 helicase-exonuclease AddAB subunit AddA [Anaerohalosphaeraceae bacterium]HPP55691.1 helicase-exonuclease AddAB subunit AddA [Anaerohalosphaeraceae bacterium]